MRILYINSDYYISSPHRVMVKHFLEAGTEMSVFVPVRRDAEEPSAVKDNEYVAPCFHTWDRLWFAGKQRKILAAARNLPEDVLKADCIHANMLFTDGNCAMALSRELEIPYVVAVRNTDVNVFFKYMVHLRDRGVEILKNAAAVFFLSPVYRDQVLDRYVPKEVRDAILRKAYVIPNGIDEYWFDNLYRRESADTGLPKDKPLTVLHVGDINGNKNLLLTAEGIQRLNRQGWDIRYRVVGRVWEETIKTRLERYGFVSFLPPQPKEQLVHEYRAADIFVMPSHTETFGLVYAEAMSQGLPVIYTRGQGFDGQFPDGTVGYSVDSHDAEELAANIVKICDRYHELSQNCVVSVQRFHWNRIVREYLQLYGEISLNVHDAR